MDPFRALILESISQKSPVLDRVNSTVIRKIKTKRQGGQPTALHLEIEAREIETQLQIQGCINSFMLAHDKFKIISSILRVKSKPEYSDFTFIVEPLNLRKALTESNFTTEEMFQKNVCQCVGITRQITEDIFHHGRFTLLEQFCSSLQKKLDQEKSLIEECESNIEMYRDMLSFVKKERKSGVPVLDAINDKIRNLDNEYHDAKIKLDVQLRYVSKWEQARIEQQGFLTLSRVQEIQAEFNELAENREDEIRTHNEKMAFLQNNTDMMSSDVEIWMNRLVQ